tara:strand:+ start:670 stop:1194 length:525 start_codon:yes stop_codon:yes gene_type:complete
MYEHLKALLLDKQTFGYAVAGFCLEVFGQKSENLNLNQGMLTFETSIKRITEKLVQENNTIPFNTLVSAIGVKQIDLNDQRFLLVFMSSKGEKSLIVSKEKAKYYRAAYNVIHSKELIKEAFFEERQKFGQQKIALENNCIWAFFTERYWISFCKDVATLLDQSLLLQEINVQQ